MHTPVWTDSQQIACVAATAVVDFSGYTCVIVIQVCRDMSPKLADASSAS